MSDTNKFHLDRSISVGHIATTVMICIGLILWGADVQRKIDINSERIQATRLKVDESYIQMQAVIETERIQTDRDFTRIEATLDRIEKKLDRTIETGR